VLSTYVARIEAGLILIEVDFFSSRKALIASQKYTPYEIGLGRLVNLDKEPFVGQEALREEKRRGPARQLVGLEVSWSDIERHYDNNGLAPQIPSTASRVAVPVYRDGKQVGKATSITWSPTLKKMIALASVESAHVAVGTRMRMEITVEAVRHTAGAVCVELPFYNPPRKMATPVE